MTFTRTPGPDQIIRKKTWSSSMMKSDFFFFVYRYFFFYILLLEEALYVYLPTLKVSPFNTI